MEKTIKTENRHLPELQELMEQRKRDHFDRFVMYITKIIIVLMVLVCILFSKSSHGTKREGYNPIAGNKIARYNAPNEVKIDSPAVNSHENAILGPVQLLPASPLIPFYSTDLLQIYNAAVALNPKPYNPASLC
ncbi:MAG: hypothetical protein KGJ07_03730, partial [Patescibacteria group bacterium]|nr:hypothetical protein [Patescibacteria group bacterium]